MIHYWLVVLTYPSEKMMEFVSWDYDIPNMMGKSNQIPWFQSPPTSICQMGLSHQKTNPFVRYPSIPSKHPFMIDDPLRSIKINDHWTIN